MSRLLRDYDNKITFDYGEQVLWGSPIFHDGIDIVGETHQGWGALDEIICHTAGTVVESEYDDGRGLHVCIDCGNGVIMTYNHLETTELSVGQYVEQGDYIGFMGATGNCTGAHLHFGIMDNEVWVDPTPFLERDYDIHNTSDITPEMCDQTRVAYVDCLDRMPDESGFDNYTRYLANGGTVEGMYQALMGSEEYENKLKVNTNDLYFVIKCYNIILGRIPESLEVAINWLPEDDSIESKIKTFNGIWLSPEAEARRNNK